MSNLIGSGAGGGAAPPALIGGPTQHGRSHSREQFSSESRDSSRSAGSGFRGSSRGSRGSSVDSCFTALEDELNGLMENSERSNLRGTENRQNANPHGFSAHRRYMSDPGPLHGLFSVNFPRPARSESGDEFDLFHRSRSPSQTFTAHDSFGTMGPPRTSSKELLLPSGRAEGSVSRTRRQHDYPTPWLPNPELDASFGSSHDLMHHAAEDSDSMVGSSDGGDSGIFPDFNARGDLFDSGQQTRHVQRIPSARNSYPPAALSQTSSMEPPMTLNAMKKQQHTLSPLHSENHLVDFNLEDDDICLSSDGEALPSAAGIGGTQKKVSSNLLSIPSFTISTKPSPDELENKMIPNTMRHQDRGSIPAGSSIGPHLSSLQQQQLLIYQAQQRENQHHLHVKPHPMQRTSYQHQLASTSQRRVKKRTQSSSKNSSGVVSLHSPPNNVGNHQNSTKSHRHRARAGTASRSPKIPHRPLDRLHRFRQQGHGHKRGFSDPGFSFLNNGSLDHLIRQQPTGAPGHQRKRSRGGYRCKFCGQLKKGHICPNIAAELVTNDGNNRGRSTQADTLITQMDLP